MSTCAEYSCDLFLSVMAAGTKLSLCLLVLHLRIVNLRSERLKLSVQWNCPLKLSHIDAVAALYKVELWLTNQPAGTLSIQVSELLFFKERLQ